MSVEPPSRLRRALGLGDAVVVGLAAMLGAGVFSGLGGVIERTRGASLAAAIGLAAGVAMLNGLSSAQLAAVHPTAGGTYTYARARLGAGWGWLAGWLFVVAKIVSCAALARAFANYVSTSDASPDLRPWIAIAIVVAATAINLAGVRPAATVMRAFVAVVVGGLLAVVASTAGHRVPPAGTAYGAPANSSTSLGRPPSPSSPSQASLASRRSAKR